MGKRHHPEAGDTRKGPAARCNPSVRCLGRMTFSCRGETQAIPCTCAGSLFALEVLHRAGVEFFEVIPFSVCAGLVCLLVFRKLTGEPYGGIWDFEAPITAVDWRHILLGALVLRFRPA